LAVVESVGCNKFGLFHLLSNILRLLYHHSTAFASICHELGHFFCRHLPPPYQDDSNWWKMRRPNWKTREFEAEIVSYIICERYGVGNKSWDYLSRVLGDSETIPEDISIERIFKAANEVERMLKEDLDPKSCLLYNADKSFNPNRSLD